MRRVWLVPLTLLATGSVVHAQTFTPVDPAAGSDVTVVRPTIVFEFVGGSVSASTRDTLGLWLDDVDLTEFAVWTTTRVTVRAPLPVPDGEHTASVRLHGPGGAVLGSVTFRTIPPRHAVTVDARLADNSTLELDRQRDDVLTIAPHADGAIATGWGTTRYDVTWTQPVGLQAAGPRTLLAPDFVVHHEAGRWSTSAGVTEVEALADSQFLGFRTHRRMVETSYDRAGFGRLLAYSNLADAVPAAGGQRSFQQWVQGVAWKPDLVGDRVSVTLLAESSRDRDERDRTSASFSLAERATLVGAVARVTLSRNWTAVTEVAASRGETAGRREGTRALRFHVAGQVAGNTIEARMSSVGSNFVNPGDPGLKSDRREAEVDVSRRSRRWNYRMQISFATDALQRAARPSDEIRYRANVGFRMPRDVRASVAVDRQQVTGDRRDRTQSKVEARLSRSRSGLHLEVRAGITETEDRRFDRLTRARMVRGAIRYEPGSRWSLSAGAGLERRAEGNNETRMGNLFVEPLLRLGDPDRVATFRLAYDGRQTPGQADVHNLSGRGSLSWSLPGHWRSVTLAVDGGWEREDDRLLTQVRTNRIATLKLVFAPEWVRGRRL